MTLLLSLFSLWTVGAVILLLAGAVARRSFSTYEFSALAVFIGTSAIGFALFFYSFVGVRFDIYSFAAIPVLLLVVMFSWYAMHPFNLREVVRPFSGNSRDLGFFGKLLFFGILIQFLWVIAQTLPYPVHSHDAVANYALKAKIFFEAGGIPRDFFSWSHITVAHPDYPLLLPLAMTWVYVFTGLNDVLVRLLMPLFYAGLLVVFFSRVTDLFSRRYALLMTFLLATVPQVSDYATIIHADLLLTAFVTIGALYMMSYIRKGDNFHIMMASFMMGSSLWIKNEAMVFSAVFAFVLLMFLLKTDKSARKKVFRDILRAAALMFFIAVPWFIVRASSGVVNVDLDLGSLTPARVWENVKHIPTLLYLFQQEVFGPKKWNIFWVIFFAALLWKRKKLVLGEAGYLALFTGLSALIYFGAYMAMTGENLYFYVNTTISRFMLHFSGIALLLSGYLLYDDVKKVWG